MVHNRYRHPGGEDQVFENERGLLVAQGHTVRTYTRHNDDTDALSALELAAATVWNRETYRDVSQLLAAERIDLMHVHNTLPLISPSVYHAAHASGVPIVQTLHNYRLACPAATFLRDGRICEDCSSRLVAWPSVAHACYRNSRSASAVVTAMLTVHRLRGTYRSVIDRYIALTEFGRAKFVENGLPAERLSVRPNFLAADPGPGDGGGGYALYVGRLSEEKGIDTLIAAWSRSLGTTVPLKIAGDGPLANLVDAASKQAPGVTWLGARSHAEVLELMKGAIALVLPSLVYEGFPMTIVESLAVGTPVVASDLGTMREIVQHGTTGHLFPRGDDGALEACVRGMADHPQDLAVMRERARAAFESSYTAPIAYDRLIEIYEQTMAERRRAGS